MQDYRVLLKQFEDRKTARQEFLCGCVVAAVTLFIFSL